MINLSNDRATLSAAATSQNNMATVNIDRLVIISIGIDEKFTWREEDYAPAIGLCRINSSLDSLLIRQSIIGDRTILGTFNTQFFHSAVQGRRR
jgi:hypothetical protein